MSKISVKIWQLATWFFKVSKNSYGNNFVFCIFLTSEFHFLKVNQKKSWTQQYHNEKNGCGSCFYSVIWNMSQVLFFPSAQAMETDFQRCCATQQVKLNLGNISIPYLFLWRNFMINEKKNKFLKTWLRNNLNHMQWCIMFLVKKYK